MRLPLGGEGRKLFRRPDRSDASVVTSSARPGVRPGRAPGRRRDIWTQSPSVLSDYSCILMRDRHG